MKKSIILLAISLAFPMSAGGAAELPLSLVERREMPYGNEQVALVFHEKHVELVLNSNFAGPTSGKIRLGKFKAEMSESMKELRALIDLENRKIQKRAAFRVRHELVHSVPVPHRPRILIGNEEVLEGSSQEELHVIIRNVQSQQIWTAVDGVEVETAEKDKLHILPLGKSKTKESTFSRKDAPCDTVAESREYCPIAGYGGIHLR